ncbi:MAG: RagB/SusD family nutrient uptake outer membrane protein [Cyclobacteriaceae bacterium]|nr:RagB/SusD family nutrient uptake outer membrane protein [Cyclobacteriaceae bacterium]
MKKINIILLSLLILAVCIVSCKDQLEEKVYSELLVNNAYDTEEDAEALIISAYAALRGTDWGTYYEYDYLMISESGTDYYGIDNWEGGNQKAEMGIWDNNYSFIINLWDGAYKVIAAANLAISVLEGMPIDEGVKAGYIGEAKFLRGLAYYDLGFNFGDVILNVGEGSGNLPLSPQSEVINQVLKDFTDAAAVLGDATAPGRASKGAALGLRAKTHLNAKNWAEAASDAKDVMELGDYDLLGSVQELFDVSNNAANEWIFAVMSAQDGTGAASQIPWFSLMGNYLNGGWGRLTIAEDFYNSFDLNDERRDLIGNGYQAGNQRMTDGKFDYYAIPGTPEYASLAADPTVNLRDLTSSSIGVTKYLGGHDRFVYTDVAHYGINYPVLRYADILLTRAEALNEGSGQADALLLLNEVRDRSNLAPLSGLDQSALRDAILEERAKELFQEGHRRLDLIRSGKYAALWRANLESKYPGENFGYIDDSKIFFPTPQKEIDANDLIGNE